MELYKRIAHDVADWPELDRIPRPIIEAVAKAAIQRIAEIVPAGLDASEMDAADFDACESCSTLIDPASPAGAHMDSDGIWLCDACLVEERDLSPSHPAAEPLVGEDRTAPRQRKSDSSEPVSVSAPISREGGDEG